MRHGFFVAALVVLAAFVVGVPTADAQPSSIFYCGDPAFRGTSLEGVDCRYNRQSYDRYGRRYDQYGRPYGPRVPTVLEICRYEECQGLRGTFHGHEKDGRKELHFLLPLDETGKPIGTHEGGFWGGLAGVGIGAAIGGTEGAIIGAGVGATAGGFIASRHTHDKCILIERSNRDSTGYSSGSSRRLTYSMVNRTGARVDLYKGGVIIHRFESGEREDFPPSDEYRAVIRLTANAGRESTRPAEIRPTRDGKSWEIVPKED